MILPTAVIAGSPSPLLQFLSSSYPGGTAGEEGAVGFDGLSVPCSDDVGEAVLLGSALPEEHAVAKAATHANVNNRLLEESIFNIMNYNIKYVKYDLLFGRFFNSVHKAVFDVLARL
jgi:hypothetical protein